ncbi:hypothetical protein OH77DRAFT_949611 [Trametes cingulata]|nr:hypothetical protein OH77DRAFT_949611 [Trametes cingulata]
MLGPVHPSHWRSRVRPRLRLLVICDLSRGLAGKGRSPWGPSIDAPKSLTCLYIRELGRPAAMVIRFPWDDSFSCHLRCCYHSFHGQRPWQADCACTVLHPEMRNRCTRSTLDYASLGLVALGMPHMSSSGPHRPSWVRSMEVLSRRLIATPPGYR